MINLTAHEITEARNVARKVNHHPHQDIATILNQRLRLKGRKALTAADVRELLA